MLVLDRKLVKEWDVMEFEMIRGGGWGGGVGEVGFGCGEDMRTFSLIQARKLPVGFSISVRALLVLETMINPSLWDERLVDMIVTSQLKEYRNASNFNKSDVVEVGSFRRLGNKLVRAGKRKKTHIHLNTSGFLQESLQVQHPK